MIKKVTASEKKKLKERLKKLDYELRFLYKYNSNLWSYRISHPENYKKYLILDDKRKQIRNKLKGYE